MIVRCVIETGEPIARLRDVFASELARTHPRSTVELSGAKGKGVFHIEAQDITSLRASINGVMSVLSTYAKVTHEL
jgi:tRNA threonylcarbamoyladenosine modification (KEOPS) complex  Pcc1 subunit